MPAFWVLAAMVFQENRAEGRRLHPAVNRVLLRVAYPALYVCTRPANTRQEHAWSSLGYLWHRNY